MNDNTGWATIPSFSSKVSVAIADAGETAVVVSMVEGQPEAEHVKTIISEVELVVSSVEEQQKPEHVKTSMSEAELVVSAVEEQQKAEHVRTSISEVELDLDCNVNEETENFLSDTSYGNARLDGQPENSGFTELRCNCLLLSDEKNSKTNAVENEKNSEVPLGIPEVCLKEQLLELPSLEETKSELSVSQADSADLQPSLTLSGAKGVSSPSSYSAVDGDLKADNTNGMMSKPSSSDGVAVPSALSCDTPETKNQFSGSRSDIGFQLGLPLSTSSGGLSQLMSLKDLLSYLYPDFYKHTIVHLYTLNSLLNDLDQTFFLCSLSVNELIGGDIKCQVPGSCKKPSPERNESGRHSVSFNTLTFSLQ